MDKVRSEYPSNIMNVWKGEKVEDIHRKGSSLKPEALMQVSGEAVC